MRWLVGDGVLVRVARVGIVSSSPLTPRDWMQRLRQCRRKSTIAARTLARKLLQTVLLSPELELPMGAQKLNHHRLRLCCLGIPNPTNSNIHSFLLHSTITCMYVWFFYHSFICVGCMSSFDVSRQEWQHEPQTPPHSPFQETCFLQSIFNTK